MERTAYPEQAYKSCSGILNFTRRVGPERLANACRWAENLGQYNYTIIEEILRKRLGQLTLRMNQPVSRSIITSEAKNIISNTLIIHNKHE